MSTASVSARPDSAVGLVDQLVDGLPHGGITLGDLMTRTGRTGTGLCLLLLSMISLVPGIAPLFGLALCAVAFGLVIGYQEPLLPQRLRRWRFDRDRTQAGLRRIAPAIRWMERFLRPRAHHFVEGLGQRAAGFASLLNGVLIVLPIPFGNTAPAVAQIILSLGLVVADGYAVMIGLLATIFALAVDIALLAMGYTVIDSLWQALFQAGT